MKQLTRFAVAVTLMFALFTGCKKDVSSTSDVPAAGSDLMNQTSATKSSKTSSAVSAKLKALRTTLPAGYEKRLTNAAALLQKTHPEYRNMVRRALGAVEPTPCDGNTPINQWLDGQLTDWDNEVIFYAIVTGMLDFPTYDALLFGTEAPKQTYGVDGDFTQPVVKTFKDLKRFWNIDASNIVMVPMHGSMLQDRERVIRIDMALYGDSREEAAYWADLIAQLLDLVPQYRNGDHPIFTFNAFALQGFNYPPYGYIKSKIVMGDGIMEGFAAIGFADVAPQAILAHEFGHHIQYQLNLFGNVSSPEATRRTELMADAYSAYYLSHARGASMQWKRVRQFLQVFFNIGDCSFTNNGHHGTPTQRLASATWAYNLANDAQKQGHILTSQKFTALFEAQLPKLVAQ